MTRKDYELIAKVITDTFGSYDIDALRSKGALVCEMVSALMDDNPRFDSSRFLAACNKKEQA